MSLVATWYGKFWCFSPKLPVTIMWNSFVLIFLVLILSNLALFFSIIFMSSTFLISRWSYFSLISPVLRIRLVQPTVIILILLWKARWRWLLIILRWLIMIITMVHMRIIFISCCIWWRMSFYFLLMTLVKILIQILLILIIVWSYTLHEDITMHTIFL